MNWAIVCSDKRKGGFAIRPYFANGIDVLQRKGRFSRGKLFVVNMRRLKGIVLQGSERWVYS